MGKRAPDLDLWGNEVPRDQQRRRDSRRKQITRYNDELEREGLTPLKVVIAFLREAIEAGDKATALRCCEIALPYTAPRLSAVTVAPIMPGGGPLVIGWQDEPDNPAVLPAVVSTSHP